MALLSIVLIGHLVTIPTAMALAEIATNQKVEGGGEYFIISRSFGLDYWNSYWYSSLSFSSYFVLHSI